MPYCPKCDMEFIEGITTCSDCGGPLVESKEVADAMKAKEREESLAQQRAEYEAMQAAFMDGAEDSGEEAYLSDTDDGGLSPAAPYGDTPSLSDALRQQNSGKVREHTQVYVKKSQ